MPAAGEEAIRVLIVDDSAEFRENVRRILQFESEIEVVGAARTGGEALQIAHETQPDVILMDINMPDMDGIAATEALLKDIPFTQIVILSVQSEADYMRRAMLAGARGFIPKPPSWDELTSTIKKVSVYAKDQRTKLAKPAQPAMTMAPGMGFAGPRREGKLLAVYSPKGGVGCTTMATNLALGLNTAETQTVVVDTNLQFGDVSVFLNLQPKTSIVDLAPRADELEAEADLVEEVLLQHDSGLRVLAAPPRPEMADEINADQVRKVLQHLKRYYAYVVVDTSSSMGDVTLAVLDVADMLIAVATPDIPAIKDARLLFDLLQILDFAKERVFFVINKMDKRSGITAEAIAENLKRAVDGEIPADDRTITASINRGVPLLMGDKTRPPTKNIIDLLGLVKQRLVAGAAEAAAAREAEKPRLLSKV